MMRERKTPADGLRGRCLFLDLPCVPAEVRHWRAIGGKTVELGCRFRHYPTSDQAGHEPVQDVEAAMETLIDRHQGRSLVRTEQRAHPRVAYTERVTILEGPDSEPSFGFA